MKKWHLFVCMLFFCLGCRSNDTRIAGLNNELGHLSEIYAGKNSRQADLLKADPDAGKGMILVGGVKKFRDEYLEDLKKKDTSLYMKAIDFNVMQQEVDFSKNVILKDISRLKAADQELYQKRFDSLQSALEMPGI